MCLFDEIIKFAGKWNDMNYRLFRKNILPLVKELVITYCFYRLDEANDWCVSNIKEAIKNVGKNRFVRYNYRNDYHLRRLIYQIMKLDKYENFEKLISLNSELNMLSTENKLDLFSKFSYDLPNIIYYTCGEPFCGNCVFDRTYNHKKNNMTYSLTSHAEIEIYKDDYVYEDEIPSEIKHIHIYIVRFYTFCYMNNKYSHNHPLYNDCYWELVRALTVVKSFCKKTGKKNQKRIANILVNGIWHLHSVKSNYAYAVDMKLYEIGNTLEQIDAVVSFSKQSEKIKKLFADDNVTVVEFMEESFGHPFIWGWHKNFNLGMRYEYITKLVNDIFDGWDGKSIPKL